MLRRIVLLAGLAGIIGICVFWWLTIPATVAASALPAYQPNLANGLTTFNAGGCSSCHAVPKQDDRTKLGGGLAIPSPFGTFYAPNISPDPNDGIGRWSEADFVTAVMKGTSPSGTHYFPAFPYTSYQHARVNDVRDLFAYLKTLPPVAGKVRDHDVPFPFNVAEWVEDCWNDNYRNAPKDASAWTSGDCRLRVLRGGNFTSPATAIRSAARFRYDVDVRYYGNGFRLVRELP